MSQDRDQPAIVGLSPWLPWPLSAWPSWTTPVRAERLAAMRIGLAFIFLLDICLLFAPDTLEYFGKNGLGSPTVFGWRFQAPRTTWSLLRGFDDGATTYLSLSTFILLTCWILGTSLMRLLTTKLNPPPQDRTGAALAIWTASLAWYVGGVWSRMFSANEPDDWAWIVPLIGAGLALLFLILESLQRWRDPHQRIPWVSMILATLFFCALAGFGWYFAWMENYDADAWWMPMYRSWQNEDSLVLTAMGLWIASVFLLLIGCCTRTVAVLTWLLSISFDNLNPNLENAGDTIRVTLLLFLMLCPCGAAWSVDAWWAKRPGPVYVHPWPIRLLFVQLIFIYFMNGLYKACGTTWNEGISLHFVLGDLVRARFSRAWLQLPPWLTSLLTWSVMIWELAFPLLVIWKWPRRVALFFGVMFHLGIFVSLEIGAFVPYALCMYLPLLPWERLRRGS